MALQVEDLELHFRIPMAPSMAIERRVHSFLLLGEGVCVIDAGVSGCDRDILAALERRGRGAKDISALVLTHAHPDHLGGAAGLRRSSGCRAMIHGAEVTWAQEPQVQFRERPVPGFDTLVSEGVLIDRELREGEMVAVGGEDRLRVIHTPGHSPGSICLFHEPSGALFCGDAVPSEGDMPIYDDALGSMGSLRRLLELRGARTLFSAWDQPAQGDQVRARIEEGMRAILRTHELVKEELARDAGLGKEELCRRCVSGLGLPPHLASPLLGRTFEAHRRALMSGFHRL